MESDAESDSEGCLSEDGILRYLNGELDTAMRAKAEEHLRECSGCRGVAAVAEAHLRSLVLTNTRLGSLLTLEPDWTAWLRSLRIVDDVDYIIERELARGGMGRVLLATDRQGRHVALKVLLGRGERATKRFIREMQVTARLQHPSIVTLYEVGRWKSGDAFFAMKRVLGRTLRDELAELRTSKDRMALVPRLIAVTDALAYAHDQGIIHRDLKPANILIGAFGETVVIDWGLAKMRGDPSLESSEPSAASAPTSRGDDTTEFGTPIGTPAYMAPEQARGDVVDERTDVYGLGALLYHVLAGCAPYSGSSTRDVLHQVLGGLPVSLAQRMPDLPTDLVAIVQKAMRPNPAERYPSAKSMAEDLRRFSAGQLVSVHAYSVRALVRRWGRKNRAAVSVAVGLLGMGAVAAWLSVDRIIEERNRAEAERLIATTHRTAAEGLVGFLITEFRDRVRRADRLDLVEGLSDRVWQYYRSIEQSGVGLDATTLGNRAITLHSLGTLDFDRRDLSKARVLYQEALAVWDRADREGSMPTSELVQYGRTWQSVGLLEYLEGHADAAVEAHRHAIALADRSVVVDPDYLPGHLLAAHNLGRICETLHQLAGDLAGSFAACAQAIARLEPLARRHPDELELQRRLALLQQATSDRYLALGKLTDAAASIDKAIELYSRLVVRAPTNLIFAREYAYTFIFLGAVEIGRGRQAEALAAVNDTIERYERIVQDDSGNRASEEDLGIAYAYRCDFERRGLQLSEAEASCRKALGIFREHQRSDRASAKTKSSLVMVLTNLGRVELAAGRFGPARETLAEAVELSRDLARAEPAGKSKEDLVVSLTWLAECERRVQRLDRAGSHAREATTIAEGLARPSLGSSAIPSSLGWLAIVAGRIASAERRTDSAMSFFRSAYQTFEQLAQSAPEMVDFQFGFARASAVLADALAVMPGPVAEVQRLRVVARETVEGLRSAGRLFAEDEAWWADELRAAPRSTRAAVLHYE